MLIVAQLIAPFAGAPEFTPSDTLFPMYSTSPIDDRRLIGVWGDMRGWDGELKEKRSVFEGWWPGGRHRKSGACAEGVYPMLSLP